MYNPSKTKANQLIVGTREGLGFRGEIIVQAWDRFGKQIAHVHEKNFIVDLGHESVIDILEGTSAGHYIFRMALGDDGTLTGQPFVPKVPDASWPAFTTLFHEVIRSNIDTSTQPTTKSMRFLTAFQSSVVDTTSFSSGPNYVVNEAGLFVSDGTQTGSQQINKTPPDSVDASEKLFSIRAFKSVPFDPAESITLTIAWTIFVQ